jgi:hypothetical protein
LEIPPVRSSVLRVILMLCSRSFLETEIAEIEGLMKVIIMGDYQRGFH